MAERKRQSETGPAWKAAEEHGVDMSLLEANLRKTPAERIRAHCRALADATALRRAMKESDERSAR